MLAVCNMLKILFWFSIKYNCKPCSNWTNTTVIDKKFSRNYWNRPMHVFTTRKTINFPIYKNLDSSPWLVICNCLLMWTISSSILNEIDQYHCPWDDPNRNCWKVAVLPPWLPLVGSTVGQVGHFLLWKVGRLCKDTRNVTQVEHYTHNRKVLVGQIKKESLWSYSHSDLKPFVWVR